MKKKIGLNQLREMDVPSALDTKILAAAAFGAARGRKQLARRRLITFVTTAAAASFAIVTGVLFMPGSNSSTTEATAITTGSRQQQQVMAAVPVKTKPRKKTLDLEKMQDFTGFEQTAFVIGQINASTNWESFEDSLI